ncbi:hypothetical protein ZWY2020_051596 [Hordeum vulgare]|nr:hypothetical protein ZWY2020_051596 [Hordeum vulgare]
MQQRMKQAAAGAAQQQQQMMQQALHQQQQQAAAAVPPCSCCTTRTWSPRRAACGLLILLPVVTLCSIAFVCAGLVASGGVRGSIWGFRGVVRTVNEPVVSVKIEPIVSGNLPPGFDSSTCRSVYVGNIHLQVTDSLLHEVFQSIGPVEVIFGFVDYYDRRYAALAIVSPNGRQLFGQPIKVNWAYASTQREDTSGHFNIFVGDLCPEVTDAALFVFSRIFYLDARVMWDQQSGRSRGFGFVSFRNQQVVLPWKVAYNRQIQEAGKENANEDGPEDNPQYTTVYVGNLSHDIDSNDVHHFFIYLGQSIEEVRVTRDKGFGFVRYSTHEEAAQAIQTRIKGRRIEFPYHAVLWEANQLHRDSICTSSSPASAPYTPGVSAADLISTSDPLL